MGIVKVLPHESLCPQGAELQGESGDNLLQLLLDNHIEIEHSCDKVGACANCHVYIREGGDSVSELSDHEDDHLEKAWGLDIDSRLSCQVELGDNDVVIEIPRYSLNLVSEKG